MSDMLYNVFPTCITADGEPKNHTFYDEMGHLNIVTASTKKTFMVVDEEFHNINFYTNIHKIINPLENCVLNNFKEERIDTQYTAKNYSGTHKTIIKNKENNGEMSKEKGKNEIYCSFSKDEKKFLNGDKMVHTIDEFERKVNNIVIEKTYKSQLSHLKIVDGEEYLFSKHTTKEGDKISEFYGIKSKETLKEYGYSLFPEYFFGHMF